MCSIAEVEEMSKYLMQLLEKNGARLDRVYYCPHHPNIGDNPKYTRECECRKPKPGMIFEAQRELNIKDISRCFMVGDKTSDILAGKRAGCKTIVVHTGYRGEDGAYECTPDYEEKNLLYAVRNIIARE